MTSWKVKTLWLLLISLQRCTAQYYQGSYGMDPYGYMQNYGHYPNYQAGYDSGLSYQGGYDYGYPGSSARAAEDPLSDSAVMSAMTPLNNVVSSVPAQPDSSLYSLIENAAILQQRSATKDGVEEKKSNCTTGCSAAPKSAVAETKTEQRSQKLTGQGQQSASLTQQTTTQTQHSTQIPLCQCPCTQGWMNGFYPNYMPHNTYPQQYLKSSGLVYYPVAHRSRQPYRAVGQYRPTTVYSVPNSYSRPSFSTSHYDPNYNKAYYRSTRY